MILRTALIALALLAVSWIPGNAQALQSGGGGTGAGGVSPSAPNIWSAGQVGAFVSVPSGATVNWDLQAGNNFALTFTTNGQLANPAHIANAIGQTGIFVVNQDATGTRQMTYAADFVFPDSITPTLQTAPFAQDIFYYVVLDATHILFSIVPVDTKYALLDVTNAFLKGQSVTPVALVDGATVTPDFSTSNAFTWTISQNAATLANPTNMAAGKCGIIAIKQDGTGSRNITTYGSFWKFSQGVHPTLTATPGATDTLTYCSSSTTFINTSVLAAMQ